MQEWILPLLRCPVSRSPLQLQIIKTGQKKYNNTEEIIINEGILWGDQGWFYPVIKGIPRLIVEAFLHYGEFLQKHIPDYALRKNQLLEKFSGTIRYTVKKNQHTLQSFTQEWDIFNYENDRTWDANHAAMLDRFLLETNESRSSLTGKLIFDAGCGNGLLNQFIAQCGCTILGMDLSLSIERAFEKNTERNALFIQGDVQYPPVAFESFDIVHSSGVLICTNNTEQSFSCLEPCVKKGGKLSVWLYHPRKNRIHNLFNFIRRFTSKLPLRLQYYLYFITILPLSYIVKRLKGNKQNVREMMIDILDWFSPQYRWEHTHDEAAGWFTKRQYGQVRVTTDELFGFNIIGVKN